LNNLKKEGTLFFWEQKKRGSTKSEGALEKAQCNSTPGKRNTLEVKRKRRW